MNNTIDKGFELSYWKLSYRRRFVRDLWILPVCLVLSILIFCSGDELMSNRVVPIALLVLAGVQLSYDYVKWNKHEKY